MLHAIKTETSFFELILLGQKTFECRKFDRPYGIGDVVILQEFKDEGYTGREIYAKIGAILSDNYKGISKGYCVFALVEIDLKYKTE
jgi:hypothetical protein